MRSGFFNSNFEGYDEQGNPIYDRAEEASFFAKFFANFIGNGVYPNPSNNMQVIVNNGMYLTIQSGCCFINGYMGLVEEGGEIVAIEPADANYPRIDRVVARWDIELRKIIPCVLKGTPASNPVAPSLTRNSNIYEIALADVAVKNNTTSITQSSITDLRLNKELCGVVAGIIDQVDTTTLFNQYLAWFEEMKEQSSNDYETWFEGFTVPSEQAFTEWFEGIKGRLKEDVAGSLQAQIDELKPMFKQILELQNPVGHIRMETTNINPAEYLGFGTWELWGSGRVPVGVDANDVDFATVEKTGGSKTVALTTEQLPAHAHKLNSHTHTYAKPNSNTNSTALTVNQIPSHNHKILDNIVAVQSAGGYTAPCISAATTAATYTSKVGGGKGHTHAIGTTSTNTGGANGNTANTGSGNAHSNTQPYITCFMWKRTA